MAEYLIQDTTLTAIADAVRAKKGTTEPISLTGLATEIESIQSGGSASNKLALVVGEQSSDNLYEITKEDLSGITRIRPYCFSICKGLLNIEIPDSVTYIGAEAFYNCTSLTSIVIPDSLTSISSRVFDGCTNLSNITMKSKIPPTITSTTFPDTVQTYTVPAGCGEAYRTADIWVNYADKIVESTE